MLGVGAAASVDILVPALDRGFAPGTHRAAQIHGESAPSQYPPEIGMR